MWSISSVPLLPCPSLIGVVVSAQISSHMGRMNIFNNNLYLRMLIVSEENIIMTLMFFQNNKIINSIMCTTKTLI